MPERNSGSQKKITLADVAKAAGLATMTVSRYLNGHPNITERTASKVRAAIEALDYRPNQAARMLMGQPSKVIGLILPNLANPFFSSIAHSVQQTAHASGYLVWIAATNDDSKMDLQLIERMGDHHVDGILITAAPQTRLRPKALGDVPLVAIDRPVSGVPVDLVTVADRTAAFDAVGHLLTHGYKRIACLGLSPNIAPIEERISGYREAMQSKGLAPLPYLHCEDRDAAVRAVRKLMSGRSPVQALFPANGAATVLALEALNELHYSTPDQVALFSFGDVELAHVFRPPISAVRQPVEQLGKVATSHLLHLIQSNTPATGVKISIPASQIIRESCGCHAATRGRSHP